uniref:Tubulintyrosine ligase family putative n=1 Tax=Albugo laibachii Nc14 TaxID=890382 RepID=F0X1X2_9STRA|nr:tubulintyrosine ligase family putative [Albugo laibachii Nc14]|eukprot:CCA27829.1 tubulintyrosine ligase family putative [Albugo laibachii Nc14]
MSEQSELQSLDRYNDSYPLLPLYVLSTLDDEELQKCQLDLLRLIGTLTDTADDVKLSKYASRQLSTVQSTLRESLALKRIAVLLASEAFPSPLSSPQQKGLITKCAQSRNNERNLKEAKPRRIVKPLISTCYRDAKNSFVISSVSPGLRKRAIQKRQQGIKEQLQSKQNTERQNRRQAAFQRLEARRKLQQAKQRVRKLAEESKRQEESKLDVSDAAKNHVEARPSRSESESDVSNCSDSDEENEKAIQMLLPTLHDTSTEMEPDLLIRETVLSESPEKHNIDQEDSSAISSDKLESHEEETLLRKEYACRLQNLMIQQHRAKCEQLAFEHISQSESPTPQVDELLNDPPISAEKGDEKEDVSADTLEVETPKIDLIPLTKPLSPKVVEYHRYFRNFHCIFSGIFEQTLASSTISSASPPQQIEQVLRLQMRLYQGWQSIMQDYQTVFGICHDENGISPLGVSTSPSTAHYRITSADRREVSEIVVAALRKLGPWEEHPSGLGLKTTWNLLWTWSKPNVERKTLLSWQRVNHFHNSRALTRKDYLKKSIAKYIVMGGKLRAEYKNLMPKTFLLPQEYVAFIDAYHKMHRKCESNAQSPEANIWIMKPVASSRGRGISLVNDLNQLVYGENVVIQRYVHRPLLINGYKFDLRLYVLVTSFNPLEAFLYQKGFVRLCTRLYDTDNLLDLFIHLTNSSVQKTNSHASDTKWYSDNVDGQSADEVHHDGGTKKPLDYLWNWLAQSGANVQNVKDSITRVVLLSLLCGEDHITHQVNSFDLYGFDILLDEDLKPWLIEINSSPSMARENDLDFQVKDSVMYDTIKLVNPLRFDRHRLVEVLSRRLMEMDRKTVQRFHKGNTASTLEEENNSIRQMNLDLTAILDGHVPRCFGEIPAHLGHYERICPQTAIYLQLLKMKKARKVPTAPLDLPKQQQYA